jgi:hypothetical protein
VTPLIQKSGSKTAGSSPPSIGVLADIYLAHSPEPELGPRASGVFASPAQACLWTWFALAADLGETGVSGPLEECADVTGLLRDARFQRFVTSHLCGSREAYLRETVDHEDDSTIRALLIPTSLGAAEADRVLESIESTLRKADTRGLLDPLILDVEFE